MFEFYTPSLLIDDYYHSLISEIDIYTDETIKEYRKEGLPIITTVKYRPDKSFDKKQTNENEKFGFEALNNPYKSKKYRINPTKIPEIRKVYEAKKYMNKIREKAIEEIRKVRDENLEYNKANKERLKLDKENLTEEKLEELKSQLFAKKYCFLVNKRPIYERYQEGMQINRYFERYSPLFNLHTVITDFYLRQSDIDYIRF